MFRRAVLLLACAVAPQSEVDRVLDAWEARVKTLTSFTCRFRQEKKVSFMRRPLVSTGSMAFRDRRLLWKTETPTAGFLSVGTDEVRIYTPEFKTLEIYPLNAAGPGGAAGAGGAALSGAFPGFSGDLSKLREPYVTELLPVAAGSKERKLRFTPRSEELKKEVVAVDVTLDEQLSVTAWKIVRASGDELALTIEQFVPNAKVSDADLTFDVPADAKIVRPLQAQKSGEAK